MNNSRKYVNGKYVPFCCWGCDPANKRKEYNDYEISDYHYAESKSIFYEKEAWYDEVGMDYFCDFDAVLLTDYEFWEKNPELEVLENVWFRDTNNNLCYILEEERDDWWWE